MLIFHDINLKLLSYPLRIVFILRHKPATVCASLSSPPPQTPTLRRYLRQRQHLFR
ncbi:hypothetical protein Hdeb2414_s0009g00322041 [Helianthus debilis subsp. tardiflorus]